MSIHYEDATIQLHHGDCLDALATLPDASVDAVVTDPPYGLEFMGKGWDAPWQESDVNADAGMSSTGYTDGGNRLDRPSFTGSTNPKCLTCKGTRRGRRDGTAKVAVCLCGDGGRFPNTRAIEMRAFGEWCEQWASECLRVLKPGGHLLAFGGTRTWHRLACAVEDAGFEVRDSIAWLYGSGFPKSLDVSKAIDKAAGVEREVVGSIRTRDLSRHGGEIRGDMLVGVSRGSADVDITAPATDAARTWQGWGTALKPAFEPVVVARKPLAGTVTGNVLAHGTGALNVDATRIGRPDGDRTDYGLSNGAAAGIGYHGLDGRTAYDGSAGRWPANVVLDDTQAAALDQQSGEQRARGNATPDQTAGMGYHGGASGHVSETANPGDTGGASRFFYVAQGDRVEQAVHEGHAKVPNEVDPYRHACSCGLDMDDWDEHIREEFPPAPGVPLDALGSRFQYEPKAPTTERVRVDGIAHPTVKPLALMRWLVRLVTPPGGTVLEPFAGSGTTVEACILEGFNVIAIEREADYLPLILQRIHRRKNPVEAVRGSLDDGDDMGLFDLLDTEGPAA